MGYLWSHASCRNVVRAVDRRVDRMDGLVVNYILMDAFVYALMGGVAATLSRLWKRTQSLPSKALLLLVSFVCISGVTLGKTVWIGPAEPEMRSFEEFLHNFASISAALAGCFVYEIKAILTGQPVEQTEEGPGIRWVIAVMEKLTLKGLYIVGGTFILLFTLGIYAKNGPPSDLYPFLAIMAIGLSAVIQGIEMWIAPRFPRLAKGLFITSMGLVIAVVCFFVRMLFYE